MAQEDFEEILRIQQAMSQRLMQEQRVDHKIDVLNIINDLTENGRKRAQTEAVLIEASMNGIAEREALQLIDELERDHMVRKPAAGFLERV